LITVLLVVSIIFVYFITVYVRHERLKKTIRISGPPNRFFFGHVRELWSTKFFSRLLQSWTKQYGSTFVYFEGQTPVYVSSDVEFLQQVFVKQFFSNFVERKKTPFERQVDERLTNLVSANGPSWKHQRHIINPAFSPGKIKGMGTLVHRCFDEFNRLVEEKRNRSFDIYEMYKRLSLDILLECEYGRKTDVQTNPKNAYFTAIAGFFNVDLRLNVFAKAGVLFPSMADGFLQICMKIYRWASAWNLMKPVPVDWVIRDTEKMIRQRLEDPNVDADRYDLVQLLVNARTEDSSDPQIKLTINEIVANCVIFLLAGYESTSAALAYCTYVIATNPIEQQKLREEIDTDWSETENLVYENVQNSFSYLDLFVQEVLRMYPIGNIACTRRCIVSTEICGIPIEKDSIIQMDMYSLHFSSDLWGPVDPHLFYPDRHKDKRHRLASGAFGCGPKNCVGQRFALFMIKLILIRLIRQYEILPAENLDERFDIRERNTITPSEIWVRVQRRQI